MKMMNKGLDILVALQCVLDWLMNCKYSETLHSKYVFLKSSDFYFSIVKEGALKKSSKGLLIFFFFSEGVMSKAVATI